MIFYLGVWNSATAVSDGEAAARYVVLSDEKSVEPEFDEHVYAFYSSLTSLYPEVEMIPENELDACPWACGLDVSGDHVIMAILPEQSEKVVPQVLALAEKHELVCFDPQAGKVYLPPHLRPRQAAAAAAGPACASGSQPAAIQLTGEPETREGKSLEPHLDGVLPEQRSGKVDPAKPLDTSASNDSSPEVTAMSTPTLASELRHDKLSLQEKIRRRAHELYVQRGSQPGSELDDWLRAEAEILRAKDAAIDEASEESFPASDAPTG